MNFSQLQKAIEILREGIENGDMEQIAEGYYELTGEQAEQGGGDPEESIEPTSEGVSEGEMRVSEQTAPSKDLDFSVKPRKEGKTRLGRREPIEVGENQFIDDGVEAMDVTTPDTPRTPRTRPAATTVDIDCHVCKKSFSVNPALVHGEFYRCDNCVTSK